MWNYEGLLLPRRPCQCVVSISVLVGHFQGSQYICVICGCCSGLVQPPLVKRETEAGQFYVASTSHVTEESHHGSHPPESTWEMNSIVVLYFLDVKCCLPSWLLGCSSISICPSSMQWLPRHMADSSLDNFSGTFLSQMHFWTELRMLSHNIAHNRSSETLIMLSSLACFQLFVLCRCTFVSQYKRTSGSTLGSSFDMGISSMAKLVLSLLDRVVKKGTCLPNPMYLRSNLQRIHAVCKTLACANSLPTTHHFEMCFGQLRIAQQCNVHPDCWSLVR